MMMRTATQEFENRSTSDWVDWMKGALDCAGFELPRDETCVLFSFRALQFADRLRPMARHLPVYWKQRLIQAAILHQCWSRAVFQEGKRAVEFNPRLPSVQVKEILSRRSENCYVAEAYDGCRYLVSFPPPSRATALAGEALSLTLARQMGLPAPQPTLALVSAVDAMALGLSQNTSSAPAGFLPCLGVSYEYDERAVDERGKPDLRLTPSCYRHIAGAAVVDVVTAASMPAVWAFRSCNGRAEVVFQRYSHAFMDGDWNRFIAIGSKNVPLKPKSYGLKSAAQLDPWVQRLEHANRRPLWELAVKLPSGWYGNDFELVARILNKLDERIHDLRKLLVTFMEGSSGAGQLRASRAA
jgi:hypothetical protein